MWLYLLICAPLVLALFDLGRDLYCDSALIRSTALRSEIGQLRSQTIRRAGRLEASLEVNADSAQEAGNFNALTLKEQPWLQSQWAALSEPVSHESYSALVDPSGEIVLHTNPAAVGKRLTSEWDDQKEPEAGGDVVRISSGQLAGDKAAYDVTVPLYADGRWIGGLHSGLDAAWFDGDVAQQQRQGLWKRSWLVAVVLAANLGAVVGLVLLARDFGSQRRKFAGEVQHGTRQLAQIGMGLAHEVRNPLHALRINIHTLRRSLSRTSLNEQQLTEMMRESDDEIDQLDQLMRDFVQFMVPQNGELANVDLAREVQATLSLIADELRRKKVELKTQFSQQPAIVHIDPARLRQIALHLLTFAQRSAGDEGTIEVTVNQDSESAELIIGDSGSALSDADQACLFEPYQATAHSNAGLRLALIRRFVLEAGGGIVRRQGPGKNCFRIVLPVVKHASQGTQS